MALPNRQPHRSAEKHRAFSSEVDTGSHKENASKQESDAPFRSHRNGALAKPAHRHAGQGRDAGYCFDGAREQ
ncbi:hypothetical protein GPL20_04410 [Bradyrhizobium cajani]|uniref:Uncharacterized protein n=1 Tax=Bradyrhizobium cajani TaxID=1928661 RepID=A0A844T8I9_9BRAD|nr:hypothetical protein [Bradyrhizobium cajani]